MTPPIDPASPDVPAQIRDLADQLSAAAAAAGYRFAAVFNPVDRERGALLASAHPQTGATLWRIVPEVSAARTVLVAPGVIGPCQCPACQAQRRAQERPQA